MKISLFLFFALTLNLGFSQEIDQRLVVNKGNEINETFKHKRNAYNFYLYELDSSYYTVNIKSLTKDEKKLLRKDVQFSPELIKKINTSEFNFAQLGIQLLKDKRQYFKVDKETVLVFYTLPEVSKKFTKSPLYTK
jgi:hypothetical protein